jgi:formate dehydrogenase major subunit
MSLVHETDYGTPKSRSTEQVTLTIDGQQVTVSAGTSIMRAAMDTGIQVPKLCATDSARARRPHAPHRSRRTWSCRRRLSG